MTSRILGLLVFGMGSILLSGQAVASTPDAHEPLYAASGSLQQTLLATRARLHQWQQTCEEARRSVKIGSWYGLALKGNTRLDALAVSRDGLPAGLSWTPQPSDGSGNPLLNAPGLDYLFTTLTADKPVLLTLELSRHEGFGGFAYRPPPSGAGVRPSDALVWLNGRPVDLDNRLDGYQRVPVAKRRGWHEAILVDVPLQKGENRLAIALGKASQRSWFNSVRLSSNPVPVLWALIENDFSRSRYHLLELVDHGWFDPSNGWFLEGDQPRWERHFLTTLLEALGPDGDVLRRRRDDLERACAPSSDGRWLDLCVAGAAYRAGLRDLATLQAAMTELAVAYPDRYPSARLLARVADLRRRLDQALDSRLDPGDHRTVCLFHELGLLRQEALVTDNPLLSGKKLLFVKRFTYDSDHYYDEFNAGIRRFGGGFAVLSLADGTVRDVAPTLAAGLVDRYDLSFDGRHILFNYKPAKPVGYRLFEIGVDGTGLRQLSFPPADENQRIATYATCSLQELENHPGRYGHWTDDMHPCYLPDGRIVFTSTRSERSVLCGGHSLTVTNLHRINADGTGLERLSQGA